MLMGGDYVWHMQARVLATTPAERMAARSLIVWLARDGIKARAVARGPADAALHALRHPQSALGPEGYRLTVTGKGVRIQANGGPGLFYGVQTLEQLTRDKPARSALAGVFDRPAYSWRGIHLDVSRHYFSVKTIERFLDVSAHYKLNVFHWHLTDDQAWRLALPAFPRLTSVASCQGGRCEAYTPQDVRTVVAYAADRAIRVVPEIEMPGHSAAALRSYPALRCSRGGDAYCPSAASARFLQSVLLEVFALFPGPEVHLGGDEVVYDARRAAFMRSMERFVRSHHRRTVVWNEALAAGGGSQGIVMSWQGERAAIRAALRGNDVVATPDGPLYFDAYQGTREREPTAAPHMSTLEQVYDANPLPASLPPAAAHHILGAQANVWTERISTADHLFYMVLPRELALAEIAWLPASAKNWHSFLTRLPAQLSWLKRRGYPFRIPNVMLSFRGAPMAFFPVARRPQAVEALITGSNVTVSMFAPMQEARVRYTLDGSDPQLQSPPYRRLLHFKIRPGKALQLKAAAFLPNGAHSSVSECVLRSAMSVTLPHGSASWDGLVSP